MANTPSKTEDQSPWGEMVERVARRIDPFGWSLVDAARADGRFRAAEIYLHGRRDSIDKAVAAIEAMREPTEEMKRAVIADARTPVAAMLMDSWRVMIDAALGRKP